MILFVLATVWWVLVHLWPILVTIAGIYITYKVARKVSARKKAKHERSS